MTEFKVNSEDWNAVLWLVEAAKEMTDDYPVNKGEMETRLMKVNSYLHAINRVIDGGL